MRAKGYFWSKFIPAALVRAKNPILRNFNKGRYSVNWFST